MDNSTSPAAGHSMGRLLQDHRAALSVISVAGLVTGFPLAGNLCSVLQGNHGINDMVIDFRLSLEL